MSAFIMFQTTTFIEDIENFNVKMCFELSYKIKTLPKYKIFILSAL